MQIFLLFFFQLSKTFYIFVRKRTGIIPVQIKLTENQIYINLHSMIIKNLQLLTISVLLPVVIFAQATVQKGQELKYRRSSLYTLMLHDPNRQYADAIKTSFESAPIPDKFNNHNLSERIIPASSAKDETENINKYMQDNQVAKQLVAKWFHRSDKGEFDMSLIGERGMYDATAMDASVASMSKRGNAMLADAGEELISNTFVVVNDYAYVNKEEVAKGVATGLVMLAAVADATGHNTVRNVAAVGAAGAVVAGKGYVVKTTSYLYQLVWDDSTAAVFYQNYWNDSKSFDEKKKNAFNEDKSTFRLKFIGKDVAWADVQSTIFTSKSETELISMATIEAVDAVIAKLQKKYQVFRTKTPLYSIEPLTAKIGLKEGITKKSKFDVLEQQIDKNGRTVYKSIGTLKVNKKQIWDNRYSVAEVIKPENAVDRTLFKKASGGQFYPGVLIKQKNAK